jgi:hypothetical protein
VQTTPENPYQPPQVECRDLRWVDRAGIFLTAGIIGLIAAVGAKQVAGVFIAQLGPWAGIGIAEEIYLYGPDVIGGVCGVLWLLGWYSIAVRRARDENDHPG